MNRPNLPLAGRLRTCRAPALLLLAAALALSACSKPASRELQAGSYRATLELPGSKSVPFGLDVAQEETGKVLYVTNGEERIRLDEVAVTPGRLQARFPGYETTLSANVRGGELTGNVTLVHTDGKALQLPFTARLGETWRFYPEALPDNADFAGRWDVTFTDGAGRRTAGVAMVDQSFDDVTGTVQMPTGDQRFLAGEAHDEELRLSRFDGGAVVLYEAKLDARGELAGETWSDRGGSQHFVATRNPDAAIDAAALASRLRNPAAPFTFAFKDLDGRTVSNSDPRFQDKVLLVTLAGSWCPNSHDEARLLVQLDRKYRSRGLEIVSLMFEQHAEFERAVAAVQRFRTAYGIAYPTLIAGTADKTKAAAMLPQLDAVLAYPTAIFIDRAGRVHEIHTGFAGPATAVQHDLLAHEFATRIEALLQAGASFDESTAPTTEPPLSP
ncbi:MAG: TlpA disulfide reductase family protein [Steroidobacteraceae bacterium]|nr:TlpA family protein disulfide reductase [Steroidobacteraceae bacterium]MBP7014479.1 TlpA family protein disulfide reductase [Steroidobacteraceae bacterium]